MPRVEKTVDQFGVTIFKIDGLIHLLLDTGRVKAIHSYIDEMIATNPLYKGVTYKLYYIEFYLSSGQIIKATYNDRELWETILKEM